MLNILSNYLIIKYFCLIIISDNLALFVYFLKQVTNKKQYGEADPWTDPTMCAAHQPSQRQGTCYAW